MAMVSIFVKILVCIFLRNSQKKNTQNDGLAVVQKPWFWFESVQWIKRQKKKKED